MVVGAGYTGTEVAAQGQLFTDGTGHDGAAGSPGNRCAGCCSTSPTGCSPSWIRACPPPPTGCCAAAASRWGSGISVEEATGDGVRLTDGSTVSTRTLVWCVGVRPDPFVDGLGLPTQKGRLVVDEYLAVPGHPEILACGDAAAVPDLTRPGQTTAMTAQHAERQGKLAGHNMAAALGHGERKAYRHHDLGFLVDLAAPRPPRTRSACRCPGSWPRP